jgi:hypothetical protein
MSSYELAQWGESVAPTQSGGFFSGLGNWAKGAISNIGAKDAISGAMAVGGLMKGAGQYANSQAMANMYAMQAQIAANNAFFAKQNATLAEQTGSARAEAVGQKTRSLVGQIEADQAANNINVNSKSAVDVRSSASELGQLDQLSVRAQASQQAYGYREQAAGFESTAQMDTYASKNAERAGMLDLASTALETGTNMAAFNYMADSGSTKKTKTSLFN